MIAAGGRPEAWANSCRLAAGSVPRTLVRPATSLRNLADVAVCVRGVMTAAATEPTTRHSPSTATSAGIIDSTSEHQPRHGCERGDRTDAADPHPSAICSSASSVPVAVPLGRVDQLHADEGPRGRQIRVVLPQGHGGSVAERGLEEPGLPLPQFTGALRLPGKKHLVAVEDAHVKPSAGREIEEGRHERGGRGPHALEGGDHLGRREVARRAVHGRRKGQVHSPIPASQGEREADHDHDDGQARDAPDQRAPAGRRARPWPDVLDDRHRERRGGPRGRAGQAGRGAQLHWPEGHRRA